MTLAQRQTYADVAAHFDKQAARYEVGCGKVQWEGPQVLVRQLRLFTPIERPLVVVDFGTGTGQIGEIFKAANNNTHVTGIDISPKMIEEAINRNRIDTGIVGDITQLKYIDDNSVDAFTSSGVLDFIPDTEQLASEIIRIVRPGGHFALTYEPEGTEHDGASTLQHNPLKLRQQFELRGGRVLAQGEAPAIYTNFITKTPVTNHFIVGSVPAQEL